MTQLEPPDEFICPTCGQGINVSASDTEQLLICPHCDSELLIPDQTRAAEDPVESTPSDKGVTDFAWDDEEESDESEPAETVDAQEDELDGLRIRQLAASRRAVYRSRSYALIAALVCLVAAIQLAINAIGRFRNHDPGIRPYAYLCFAIAALMAFIFFIRRMLEFNREVRKAHQDAVDHATPDFTPLSDGSQRWKHLDNIE
jgi:hypothetical protein